MTRKLFIDALSHANELEDGIHAIERVCIELRDERDKARAERAKRVDIADGAVCSQHDSQGVLLTRSSGYRSGPPTHRRDGHRR